MLFGTLATLLLIYLSPTIQVDILKHQTAWFPLKNPALLTIPLSFIVGVVVSLLGAGEGAHDAAHERRMHLGEEVLGA
jgi:cation/acetate symporter